MANKSGLEQLLDALRESGGGVPGEDKSPVDVDAESSSREGSGGSGRAGGGSGQRPEVVIPFADKIAQWGKRALIIGAIVLLVVIAVCYWWFHPPINIHSVDTWYFVAIFVLLPVFMVFYARHNAYKKGGGRLERNEKKAKTFKWLSFLPLAVVVVGLIGALVSMPIFPGNAQKFAKVLNTDQLEFATDIKEVDYSEIPVIDRNSAALLGNRTMGEIPDYVSQFEISPLYSQINYKQGPVRVSPLGYADIFKWWNNREAGIPAYVMVDMRTQDTDIVRLKDGIRYSQSEPLGRNIDRYVQLKYPFYMFDEKSFEIDDDGNPWWICPVKQFTIGLFGGQTISRVVMVNASTGECNDILVEEVPQWVDRVYPAELLVQQYNWSGAYMDGWLNSWLGQQGVKQTTPGTNGMLGYNYIAKDDDVWVYSGVTSATSDNSIIGFVLVNQRTAKSHFYSVAGATEDSAMNSAQGQIQHLRYNATFPILINISNQPTYFMALKDDAGLVKMYAMLDIRRYQNVAVGDTVSETQKVYKQLLATNGVLSEEENEDAMADLKTSETKGKIASIALAVIDGNSHFYVRLVGDSAIYDFALPAALEIVAYQIGDEISFSYIELDPACLVTEITSDTPENPAAPAG